MTEQWPDAARLRVRPSLSDARQVNLFARSSRSCA